MSRSWTNVVRVVVATLLGLSACLVAWWPQSAAGSGVDFAAQHLASAPKALATQKSPTGEPVTQGPAPADPPASAPPPPAPPPTAKPTKKPTKKPSSKPPTFSNNGNASNGGNNGGNNGGKGSKPSKPKPPPSSNTGSGSSGQGAPSTVITQSYAGTTSGSGTTTQTNPPAEPQDPASQPTSAPTTEAPVAPAAPAADAPSPEASDAVTVEDATDYQGYLTSSEPVQTKSAPVWVVPGILLVLTSMLALLGGVLGRANRSAPEPATAPASVKHRRPRSADEG